ncbi:MAG: acetoacetate decarboxylase family protein [Deltaproteobacteria bacterium]|nr:acetoacetate decarboxylase family protein [Deltaproteobacteria bacterium]
MTRSPFFEGLSRIPIRIAGHDAAVPFLIYDGDVMTAVFAARYRELRRLLPDARFVPARIAPGVGIIAVNAGEYRRTDVGPYNELVVSIMLNEPPFWLNFPGRALLGAHRRRQYHAFVQRVAVNTPVSFAGGEFYGFPKFMARVEFSESGDERVCRVMQDGQQILTLRGKRLATPHREEIQTFCHLWSDRQPQSCEFKINALAFGGTSTPLAASIDISSSHPVAVELSQLLLWRRAIHFRRITRFEGILYGPDRHSLALLRKARDLVAEGDLAVLSA